LRTDPSSALLTLHLALERLNVLRRGTSLASLEAQKALAWLDHITSVTGSKAAGRVQLQGPDDLYQSWPEVEKYLLPDTPLSSQAGLQTEEALSEALQEHLIVDENLERVSEASKDTTDARSKSPSIVGTVSSSTSPTLSQTAPAVTNGTPHLRHDSHNSSINGSRTVVSPPQQDDCMHNPSTMLGIPAQVRPLLNFVVWRTHHEDPTIGGTGKYILLTNDPTTQRQAQKFGVRAKLLSQVRGIVARDNKVMSGSNGNASGVPTPTKTGVEEAAVKPAEGDDDEDEVVFKPAQRPASSNGPKVAANVLDPDHFGRSASINVHGDTPIGRGNFRNGRGNAFIGRGNLHAHMAPIGPAANRTPAAPMTIRSLPNSPRGRASSLIGRQPRFQNNNRPIDPDSYTRPPPMMRGRGRGGFRRLWEPN